MIPACTLSPIFNSDIVTDFPFLNLSTAKDGKQPFFGGGGATNIIVCKFVRLYCNEPGKVYSFKNHSDIFFCLWKYTLQGVNFRNIFFQNSNNNNNNITIIIIMIKSTVGTKLMLV